MNPPIVAYKKGAYHAEASIIETADGRFQGIVRLIHPSENSGANQHRVPVASDTREEALDEAKALAHRLLADLQ